MENVVPGEVKETVATKGAPSLGAPPIPGTPSGDTKLWLTVEAQIAEYNKLRDEINLYHDHQKEEIYFSILAFGGMIAVVLAPANLVAQYEGIFLLFPFLFTALAAAYADRTIRILRIATYIHNHLRENLVHELGTTEVMEWEVFKKHRVEQRKKSMEERLKIADKFRLLVAFRQKLPELPKILDIARSLQFVMPSIVAVALFVFFRSASTSGFDWLAYVETTVGVVVALLPLYLFTKTEETSGISLNPEHRRLAKYEAERRAKGEARSS